MPIPDLTGEGWLPPGNHSCTLEELEEAFAGEDSSDGRREIFAALVHYLERPNVRRYGHHLLVDGGFVSRKVHPKDVDLVFAVLPGMMTQILGGGLGVSPDAVIREMEGWTSPKRGGERLVQAFACEPEDAKYRHFRDYFQQSDREGEPDVKGILRVNLR